MEPKTSKERFFSVELRSKLDLKSVTIPEGNRENVLVEGTIGELVQIGFTEGIILEITGEKGVLRIDIGEDEIAQATLETDNAKCEKSGNASSEGGRTERRR